MKKNKKVFWWCMVYRLVMMVMLVMIITLSYLINKKIKLVDLSAIEKQILQLSNYLPLEPLFSLEDSRVSKEIQYNQLSANEFENGSNQVVNLESGIVESISKDEVVILNDQGNRIVYQKLDMIHVMEKERVLKGVILGSYHDQVEIHFYDGQKEISYESWQQIQD